MCLIKQPSKVARKEAELESEPLRGQTWNHRNYMASKL